MSRKINLSKTANTNPNSCSQKKIKMKPVLKKKKPVWITSDLLTVGIDYMPP